MLMIHCGDLHLGSPLSSTLPTDVARQRRNEMLSTFRKIVEYAQENEVKVILLCGDIFDSGTPFKKDTEYFFSLVRNYPDIDFLYLRGNHDRDFICEDAHLPNLKRFSDEWVSYRYGNVTVSGIELTNENAALCYGTLPEEAGQTHIVLMHGSLADPLGEQAVSPAALKGKHIDYLALGHLHSFQSGMLNETLPYAYCGIPEGRGFDETGQKGFVLLEVNETVSYRFIPFACAAVREITVDVTGLQGSNDVYRAAMQALQVDAGDIVRLILTGETDLDCTGLENELADVCRFLSVKDMTRPAVDIEALRSDRSLKGEFVRRVEQDETLTPEERRQVMDIGLRLFAGGDL